MRLLMFIGLGFIAVLISAQASAAELTPQIYHCPTNLNIQQVGDADRCTLTMRPVDAGQRFDNATQTLRVRLHNPLAEPTSIVLSIRPFYLANIELYIYRAGQARLTASGGALHPSGKFHQTLGGHEFIVNALPGANDYVVQIDAPGFAQIAFAARLMQSPPNLNDYKMGISLHIGMLLTLAGLALIGWVLRRDSITLRLFLITVTIVIQVGLGSGAIPLMLPTPALIETAMTLFISLVAIRVALWGWLYQGLIAPQLPDRWYQYSCHFSYIASGITAGLYFLDMLIAARFLTLFLILSIPVLHTVGAMKARSINPVFKVGLVSSLLIYDALQVLALYLVIMHSATTELPILITRVLDITVPLLAMSAVLLRNWANDQALAAAAQTLARQEAQLQSERESQQEKSMLLDMLTHEIKNPLTTIGIAANSLEGQWPELTDPVHKRFVNIRRAVNTIDQVIDRCDLSTRIDGQAIEVNRTTVAPYQIIKALGPGYEANWQRVILTGSPHTTVTTDSSLLQTVLSNLLDNAFRYSPENSNITAHISDADEQGFVSITLSNRLTPDASPDPDRLFTRYYRHGSAKHIGGSGLGLSLCDRVITLLGGSIKATIDNGCITFSVRLRQ
ncbi:MAG: hypothetical protein KGY57_05320 [Gammaproteobacteria bacterium]|nr:hypothetical protein [Gammaproteobacteria bacterium]